MAVLFRLGFGLLLCPAADIADKAAAVDVAETEAVVVDVHLFHHSNMIGSSQSTVTKILGRFIENPKKETLVAMCDKLHLTYDPKEIGRFEYSAAAFSKEELTAFNDVLEAKLREGKTPEDIIKTIQEI